MKVDWNAILLLLLAVFRNNDKRKSEKLTSPEIQVWNLLAPKKFVVVILYILIHG